jgi:hypothetical protein
MLHLTTHECWKNHDGSSSAMEPHACLDMTIDLFRNKYCQLARICCDDDASTRSLLRWSNADYMKNTGTTEPPKIPISKGPNKGRLQPRSDKGKLPAEIPEPKFVADPNHRVKVLKGELYSLAMAKKETKKTMTKNDASRLGKNYSYFVRSYVPSMRPNMKTKPKQY